LGADRRTRPPDGGGTMANSKEIDANRKAWSLLARDHYEHYRRELAARQCLLNRIVLAELGEVAGRTLIHLQCNTGADTISLARLGAKVTGVDLSPDNVRYARQLALDFGIADAEFIESDIMELLDHHQARYDIVFTSEGAIGWLPDKLRWAHTVRHLLQDGGFLYVFDSHPFFLALDEGKLRDGVAQIKYPYFARDAEEWDEIGGYASTPKQGTNYFWPYTVGDIINSLVEAGMCVEYFREHDLLYFDEGGMAEVEKGLFQYPGLAGRLPCTFSLRATVRGVRS